MQQISLVILGEPKAQKRHRHTSRGKFVRTYDPSAADKQDFLSVVKSKAPETPFMCPLRVIIDFYFTRPKSHYKSGKYSNVLKDSAPTWHTGKPDVDNCVKMIFDALNKVYWRDDSILCEVGIRKRYDFTPRIEIKITQAT